MSWLHTLDTELFRWINIQLANPLLDVVMPFLSGNAIFYPLLILLAAWLIWKGRLRGLLCILLVLVAVAITDGLVVRSIKAAVLRPRPFLELADVRCLVGKSSSGSMPSAHAANWFAAAMVFFLYYRRSVWLLLPLGSMVAFSRVYNGVHYPSDVLAGAVMGAGVGAGVACALQFLWSAVGRKWFPLWWEKLPSVLNPPTRAPVKGEPEEDELPLRPPPGYRSGDPNFRPPGASLDQHWLNLGYVLIAVLLLARLSYIAGPSIQLSEDEAYQWVWSKHLDLSYYSKPPLIAYIQFLGTSLWGDNAFGVRFFSPVIAAVISLLVLRFFAREVNARAGFALLLITTATPMMSAGAVLMTIDPPSVLFWTAAMVAGWRAVQERSTTRDWVWVGVWMGFGFLSKYTQLFQLLSWALFFLLWAPARKQLRRPGPYLALFLNALFSLPVLIWNAQRNWITVSHLADNAGARQSWKFTTHEFLGAELGLLNPVFFVAAVWAAIAFWRRGRRNPKALYFFSMGAPLFIAYLLLSFRSRVLPNWIAPAVVPLFCLMVLYWDAQFRLGRVNVKRWFYSGLAFGIPLVVLFHDTDIVKKLAGHYLPLRLDPLHRVRRWRESAEVTSGVRQELLQEGKPVFIIAHHYGLAGTLSFYMPEARTNIKNDPLVFYPTSPVPRNQFFFLPGYTERKGQNALFVLDLDWDYKRLQPAPEILYQQFESVTELGMRAITYHNKTNVVRWLQFWACRGLK